MFIYNKLEESLVGLWMPCFVFLHFKWVKLYHSEFLAPTFLSSSDMFLSKHNEPPNHSDLFLYHSVTIRVLNVYPHFLMNRRIEWRYLNSVRREVTDPFIPSVFVKERDCYELRYLGEVSLKMEMSSRYKENRMNKHEIMIINFLSFFSKKKKKISIPSPTDL